MLKYTVKEVYEIGVKSIIVKDKMRKYGVTSDDLEKGSYPELYEEYKEMARTRLSLNAVESFRRRLKPSYGNVSLLDPVFLGLLGAFLRHPIKTYQICKDLR
ncbi:MAG: hypothetical protein QMD85_03975 [Candidatus Aenigmarchaeota archaeon]|nr:hypothetical protein [Candidatus Aenigmarchaeota archaeon]